MITQNNLISIAAAWAQLKKNPEQSHYVDYDTDRKKIKFIMERNSWYYGKYATFIDGFYFASFSEDALDFVTRSHFYGEYPEFMQKIHDIVSKQNNRDEREDV